MKILLIEDNPTDQMFVSQSLRNVDAFRYELALGSSLAEAIGQLESSTFDVILLDLWLPDCEGLETLRSVLAVADGTPVVVMTGTNDIGLATQAIRSGAQDYLVKGAFPGSVIVRVLQYSIDRSYFRRELTRRDEHLRQILCLVPAIIWTTDRVLTITGVQGAGLRSLNLDPQLIIGMRLSDYLQSTGESDGAVQAHQQALEGQSVSLETEWLGRIFELKINPLHDCEQRVSGTIGVALDVTERRRLDREMTFARRVQEALLPRQDPCVEGFEIFGGACPAKVTCGDWFDYLTFPDGSVGLVVGDVSGKGFGPAILSAAIAAFLEALAAEHSNLREILRRCDRLVGERELDGQFACLSIARLQPGIRTLTYAGAGDGMLIIGGNGQLRRRLPSSGMPVGLFAGFGYEAACDVPLESGDILLLLTDGFREACNRKTELFGESRIVETVAAHRRESAGEIFEALRQTACEFAGGDRQGDDMTGIVVKVT